MPTMTWNQSRAYNGCWAAVFVADMEASNNRRADLVRSASLGAPSEGEPCQARRVYSLKQTAPLCRNSHTAGDLRKQSVWAIVHRFSPTQSTRRDLFLRRRRA